MPQAASCKLAQPTSAARIISDLRRRPLLGLSLIRSATHQQFGGRHCYFPDWRLKRIGPKIDLTSGLRQWIVSWHEPDHSDVAIEGKPDRAAATQFGRETRSTRAHQLDRFSHFAAR